MTDQESCRHIFVRGRGGEYCKICNLMVVDAKDLALKKLETADISLDDNLLILLYLLPEHKSTTDTKLMKEVFLTEREGPRLVEKAPTAGFIPDKYGPCAHSLYIVMNRMQSAGIIRRGPGTISGATETRLTKDGYEKAEKLLDNFDEHRIGLLQEYLQNIDSFDLKELLRYVYTRYPSYIVNSEIKNEVLKGGEKRVQRNQDSG